MKLILFILLLVVALFAKTEVISVVGGAGDNDRGGGNIDGIGKSAAIHDTYSMAKTPDNQIIIGDYWGIKKINPATNEIKTLWSYENSSINDIEIDSSGNIYVSGDFWVADPHSCNDSQYTFRDSRIYKFSASGTMLQSWGNACITEKEDFTSGQYGGDVSLAIDNSDRVYAISHYSATALYDGKETTTLRTLNMDGTTDAYFDLQTLESGFKSVKNIDYDGGYLYIGIGGSAHYQSVYRFNLQEKTLEFLFQVSDPTSNSAKDIIFKDGEIEFIATPNAIFRVFQHNGNYRTSYVVGQDSGGNPREPAYQATAPELYDGIDGLYLQSPDIGEMVEIDGALYFTTGYYSERILKATFPSNEAPTLTTKEFPQTITKGGYTYFKFDAEDSDGFSSVLYCDFDDAKGEKKVWSGVYNDYGHANISAPAVTYKSDGDYTLSCTLYDNEGLATSFSKSFTVGEKTSCDPFSLERDEQQVALKVGDEDYFNISVCDDVQILSSDESIVLASRYTDANIDELQLKALSDGKATVTLSDSQGEGHLYVTVGTGVVAPITTPDTKQNIGNITFLEYEPDGYFGWSDADKFCKERGYRLPSIKELNYVWNISDKTPSPVGFEKDTFYWASESVDDGASHKACAMDVECSSDEGAWPSVGGNGHPKCVVSVNGSLEIDTGDTPSSVLWYHVNETQDNRKEVDINLGDKRVDVSLPKETTVTQEDDKSIHMQTNPDSDGNSVETVLKENGTLEQVTKKLIDNLVYRTTIIIDYIVESNRVEEDGSSLVKMLIKTLNLEIKTEATAEMSASYSLNGKNIQLPIFSAGSQMHVKSSGEDVLIEVQTKLTTTLRF